MTTPLFDLLRHAYINGARLDLIDEHTVMLRGQPLSADLIADLRANKEALLQLLREQRIGRPDSTFHYGEPRCYATPPECLADRACAHLGPCSQFLMRQPCDHGVPDIEDAGIDLDADDAPF